LAPAQGGGGLSGFTHSMTSTHPAINRPYLCSILVSLNFAGDWLAFTSLMEKKEREKIRDLALMRRTGLRSTRRSHAASVVQLFATPVIMLGWKKFSPKPLA
jgi:hypothetical protein